MSCTMKQCLHYDSPSHGDWGISRLAMLVPESILFFVGPSACARHGALGAYHNRLKDRMFYLFTSESDIIGGYADLIPDAIEELFSSINKRPRVVMMLFTCLDDLIGTDHEMLAEMLTERFPDVVFRSCHMNPIASESASPPMTTIQNNIYSVISPSGTRDKGVNTIGNYAPLSASNELRTVLAQNGFGPVRHIGDYTSFDAAQEMGASCLTLTLNPVGCQAGEQMQATLGMPALYLPVSYDLTQIRKDYAQIATALSLPADAFDLTPYEQRATNAIQETLELVKDLPLIIDSSATTHPFNMAKALLTYGFHVVRVEAQMTADTDEASMHWIEETHPEIGIFRPEDYDVVRFDRRFEDALSIGIEAAYLSGSKHITDLFCDIGMFGYDGVVALMERIRNAAMRETDLRQLIDDYGLVV